MISISNGALIYEAAFRFAPQWQTICNMADCSPLISVAIAHMTACTGVFLKSGQKK